MCELSSDNKIQWTVSGGGLRGRSATGKPAGAPRAAGDRLPVPAPNFGTSLSFNNIITMSVTEGAVNADQSNRDEQRPSHTRNISIMGIKKTVTPGLLPLGVCAW